MWPSGGILPAWKVLSAVLCALMLSGASSPLAQEEPPSAGAPASPGETPSAGPEQEPGPDSIAPFLVREYAVKPKKLWKGLLAELEAAGYPPEEVDQEAMKVKTSFVDFKKQDYSEQVAEPPPMLGSDYHIVQMVKVAGGKVSLEASVAPQAKGAELRIRARILVQGLDRRRHLRVFVDRRSAGVIEGEFLIKLQDRLRLERL
jgi:hypothetical protein